MLVMVELDDKQKLKKVRHKLSERLRRYYSVLLQKCRLDKDPVIEKINQLLESD